MGRQAYVQGSRLAVWQVITLLRDCQGDVTKAAAHLHWPAAKVHAAVAYAEAYPDEIEDSIRESESVSFEILSHLLPGLQRMDAKSQGSR